MSDSATQRGQIAQPRPPVAVVMPFAGTVGEARTALAALASLRTRPGDRIVLADNTGTAPADASPGVEVVPADGEHSPSRARNAGAAAGVGGTEIGWLVFIDADCRPAPDLLDAFFAEPIADGVAALAGEIRPVVTEPTSSIAARYGATRNFLDSTAHLAHPFRPRLAAANLLVRRVAFDDVGGFQEGIRAAEDTDLCWRLQDAGWTLAVRAGAVVGHAYRPTLRDLRAQWRGYAAGRAWLARRYPGFTPQPALLRAAHRLAAPGAGRDMHSPRDEIAHAGSEAPADPRAPLPPLAAAAVDGLLGVEELIGLGLSNRPRRAAPRPRAETVLVGERFPTPNGKPDGELDGEPGAGDPGTRVEAGARPPGPHASPASPWLDYREDDGALQRALATVWLALVHPREVVADRRLRGDGPALPELAPAALRLRRDRGAAVRAFDGPGVERIAARLRALAGAPPR